MECFRKETALRLFRTLNLSLASAGMGLFFSMTGVALLDLAGLYCTNVETVAQLVTTRGIGTLVGSFVGGRLYDAYHTQVLSVALCLAMCGGVLATPLCGRLVYAHVPSVVGGFATGALDTGANIWLVNLWPSNCGPAMQVYHFAFGMGALIAPFITEPFLSLNVSATSNVTATSDTVAFPWAHISDAVLDEEQYHVDDPRLRVDSRTFRPPQLAYAFGIVSAFNALVAAFMFTAYLIDRSDSKPPVPSGETANQTTDHQRWFSRSLMLLVGLYVMMSGVLECAYGQMLPTYAVNSDLRMTKSQAAYLTSCFFCTFTIARIGSAFWSLLASPSCILLTCQVLLVGTFTLLVFFGSSSSAWLWTLSGVAGVSLAAAYGTGVSYAVQFLLVTGKMMSAVTVGAALATMAPPLLVGPFIEEDPVVLAYVCLAATLVMSALYFAMHLLTRGKPVIVPARQVDDSINAVLSVKACNFKHVEQSVLPVCANVVLRESISVTSTGRTSAGTAMARFKKETVLRLVRTLNLDLACVGMGLFFSVTGVALLDLADVYSTDVRSVAQLVTTRGVGILVGGFIGGRLYDAYNTQVLSIAMLVLTCGSVMATPLCGWLIYAHVTSVLSGFAMGALDTGANIWLINLWPSNCGPALQVYHFAFGVGAFVAPFITEPFLSLNVSAAANATATSANITNPWGHISGMILGEAHNADTADMLEDRSDDGAFYKAPQLGYAFGIVAAFNALVAVSMVVAYIVDRSDIKPPVPCEEAANGDGDKERCFSRTLMVLLALYIMVYLGLECSYGQMLPTFAVRSDLQMTKSEAAYLTSLFFLTFTIARIVSAFWSLLSSPSCILLTCQVLLVVTFALLVFFGSSSATWLWALSGVAGIVLAPVFAAAVSFAVQFLVMSNKMMSVVTVAASLGTMVPPVLVGLFIQDDPMVLTYVCSAAALMMTVLFFAMRFVTRGKALVTPETRIGDST
ncbi:uncharacterized protein LOC144161717 [Haemaphysalis longicornis]